MSDKKVLAAIESSLQPGETIVDTVHGAYIVSNTNSENTIGILALTTKRLVFSGSIGFKREQHSLALNLVTSVDLVKGMMLSHLQVTSAGSVAKYRVKYNDAQKFLEATNAAVAAAHEPAAATLVAPDHAAQLKQIAELRDSGILTEEEFAAKKAEILARM